MTLMTECLAFMPKSTHYNMLPTKTGVYVAILTPGTCHNHIKTRRKGGAFTFSVLKLDFCEEVWGRTPGLPN